MGFIRKIKAARRIKYPWILSPFKLADGGYLEIHDQEILIKSHREFIRINQISSLHLVAPKGFNFESWVEIRYSDATQINSIFLCDYEKFGLGFLAGGNEIIMSALEEYHTNQNSNT